MPRKLEVTPLVKKFNAFAAKLSIEDQIELYTILAALRGPDSNDPEENRLKKAYTSKMRSLLFPHSASSELAKLGIMASSAPRFYKKEIDELAEKHMMAPFSSDHFIDHLFRALCAMHGLDHRVVMAKLAFTGKRRNVAKD